MNPNGCRGMRGGSYTPPSEKQLEVFALAREVECAEFMLEHAKKRLEKASEELAIEKAK